MLRRVALAACVGRLLVTSNVVPSSPILVTLMMEALGSSERRFLQEPHGVTSQKTPCFIVTAMKHSKLPYGIHVSIPHESYPSHHKFYPLMGHEYSETLLPLIKPFRLITKIINVSCAI
jgi:hypothetical protein